MEWDLSPENLVTPITFRSLLYQWAYFARKGICVAYGVHSWGKTINYFSPLGVCIASSSIVKAGHRDETFR